MALRDLMAFAYAKSYGPTWLDKLAGAEKLAAWSERATVEEKSRGKRGVVGVPSTGLAYANLYDLIAFADRDWEPLAPALGKKKDTLPLLQRVDSLRNAVGHSRALLVFEEDLLAGIAGQIRNQVTIFMSTQDPAGDIYPRIESVTDSFGRQRGPSWGHGQLPAIVLHPGDIVTFTCFGTDPQNRALLWRTSGTNTEKIIAVADPGQPATLTWLVEDRHVSESTSISIRMEAPEAKYHRSNSYDGWVMFDYIVRPPLT